MKFSKKILLSFILSITIYLIYMILTPLKFEFLAFFSIFLISFLLVFIFDFFIYLIKLILNNK